jgi:hypothetical protein
MKIKVATAVGSVLDWMVATAQKLQIIQVKNGFTYVPKYPTIGGQRFTPTTDPAQAYPIIEREGITVAPFYGNWTAARNVGELISDQDGDRLIVVMWESEPHSFGPTPLIAAMRCYVVSKLGEEVEVPDELV